MFPVLAKFNKWFISTLGVLYTLAFLVAFLWSLRRGPTFGINKQNVCDITIISMLSFLMGSRAYYVLLHWSHFKGDPVEIFDIFRGGTAQYGGVLLFVVALTAYARLKKLSIASLGSALSAPFFLGVAVGRLGCFANGCCFGLPTSSFLGVHFPPWAQASRAGRRLLETAEDVHLPGNNGADVFVPAVHPAQLYSAAGALICMGIILWVQRRTTCTVLVISVSIGLLGLLRLVVDQFRYYDTSAFFLGLPINSWISIVLLCASLTLGIRSSLSRQI